ncbi:Uncharacterised protein [uncultured archaeon]|nr:Uncharacterised protein [uncultured archaeon]
MLTKIKGTLDYAIVWSLRASSSLLFAIGAVLTVSTLIAALNVVPELLVVAAIGGSALTAATWMWQKAGKL